MTTPEAPAEPATFKIVVCGTCDVVFRTHPGRPTCPACGGDPDLELGAGTIETPSDEVASSAQSPTPAPAEATSEDQPDSPGERPSGGEGLQVEEATSPEEAAADEVRPHFDEVEKEAQEAAAAARAAGWDPGLQ